MKYLGAITNDYDLVTKKYVDDATEVIQTITSGTKIGSVGGINLYAPSGGGGGSGTVTSIGITNGGGLSISGSPVTSSGNITVGHSNSVPAGTIGSTGATSGASVSIPYATYDSNGHITGKGTHTHTITGFLTEETDPTVPSWAKESTKPSYTASEVGAIPIGSNGIYFDNSDSGTKTISANSTADFSWTYKIPTGYMAIAMSANVRSVGNYYGRVNIFGFSSSISGNTMTLSCGSRNNGTSNATGISIRARILVIKNG